VVGGVEILPSAENAGNGLQPDWSKLTTEKFFSPLQAEIAILFFFFFTLSALDGKQSIVHSMDIWCAILL
jgi:hypothetical protein